MLHPDTELRKVNPLIGYGVFATRPIPRGTISWVLDPLDQILDGERVDNLENRLGDLLVRYTWPNREGKRILCWDFARYMNHSCEANSFSPGGFNFEIAVRDIAIGDELTNDYGSLNLDVPFHCDCQSSRCRRTIRPEDFDELAPGWDVDIRRAFSLIRAVEQPLWEWVVPDAGAIDRLIDRPDAVPSILVHRWRSPQIAAASGEARPILQYAKRKF